MILLHSQLFTVLACVFGLLMTWGVGANDLANIMSTTMGSKAISVRQAILLAIIFEFAGALFGSSNVTATIRTGIIDTQALMYSPDIFVLCMLAVLLAGTTWMITASFLGLPVSITNATVGSIVGCGSLLLGIHAIHWQTVGMIATSWVISPAIACFVALILFRSVQRFIFSTHDPERNAKRSIPFYLFFLGGLLGSMIVLKGFKHFHILLNRELKILTLIIVGLITVAVGQFAIQRIEVNYDSANGYDRFAYVEKLFGILMAFTACAMVFAHGSNDVAIAVGPMSAVISTAHHWNVNPANPPYYHAILLWGCSGVILGFLMYGRKVIATVGSSITTLTPSRAFAATLAAASTVVVSTTLGIPVSATQTLVGGVFGVGLARGIGALNLTVIRNILMSWIFTIPAASLLTISYFYAFRWIFGVRG